MAVQLASSSTVTTEATATATALATVTSDDSCAKEVPGAGPCCDGHPLYDDCHQVCDWLLMCDNGYVPELTDDSATRFPETSDYQPHNCLCRGDEEIYHDGCFCRQVREMVYKFENNDLIGYCDPCPPPPPTPPPTTRVYDPSHDYCFTDDDNDGKYCWYPTLNLPVGNWEVKGGRGYNDCGTKCTKVDMYDRSQDDCFKDIDNDGKYCWYRRGYWPVRGPGAGYDNCDAECTEVVSDHRDGQ